MIHIRFHGIFFLKILESPWKYKTKMIHDYYDYMQIDFMERTYTQLMKAISTRSIQIVQARLCLM